MRHPFRSPRARLWKLAPAALGLALLLACPGGRNSGPAQLRPASPPSRNLVPPGSDQLRLSFHNTTQGPLATLPAYAVVVGRDRSGAFIRLDRTGRFLPCSTTDNVVPRDGRTWCDYGIPLQSVPYLDLDRAQALDSGRIYLSVGGPPWLRVDEATGGLVQPDPANPADPNRDLRYDWIELTLDSSGFHGNTTCVDQFGLPISLTVTDRRDPDHPLGPVGLAEARSALFRAYRAGLPAAFAALAQPGDTRILAPAHGGFGPDGPDRDYLQGYLEAMWLRYRAQPLVLTPDEGRFTGRVDPQDRMVFTRDGDPATYTITARPTTQEVFLGDGVLAQGNGTEKVLGAQLAALLNRHLLEDSGAWRDPAGYYRRSPCNRYAQFWHQHGLGRRAYGFAYDDVADQSSSLATPSPLEISLAFRWD